MTPKFCPLPGMRPTAAGESVIVMARRWRADADRLETDLLEMRGKEYGSVRLAGMDSLCNGVLLDLHKDLRANQPNLRLSLDIMTPTEALRALEEGTVDVAMTFTAPPMRHQHVLWQRKLRLGCIVAPNHPLATAEKLSLSDVDGHALVSQSALMPTRQYLDNRHAWFFASNRPVLTSNSIQLLKQALLQGDVAMITSELDMLPELMDGRLRFLPLKEAGLASPTISTVIDARRPLSRAARVVAEYLGTQTEELISAFAEPTAP